MNWRTAALACPVIAAFLFVPWLTSLPIRAHAAQEAAAPRVYRGAEESRSYNPNNLSIITLTQDGRTTYTVRDGSHWITNYPTFTDAYNALQYMRGFNMICFEGRGTNNIRSWFEKR